LSHEFQSRRGFLRWTIYSAIGTVLILTMGDLNKVVALTENNGTNASFPLTTSVDTSFLKVKVGYLLMAQYIDTSQEYFVLQNPATLLNLLGDVANRHPTITGMIASMQILINGVTAQFSSTLKDGDEVDFIPLVTGG